MVRVDKLRTELHLWPEQDASSRAGRKQVHLVRIDGQRRKLHLQSDGPAREVTESGGARSIAGARGHSADAWRLWTTFYKKWSGVVGVTTGKMLVVPELR